MVSKPRLRITHTSNTPAPLTSWNPKASWGSVASTVSVGRYPIFTSPMPAVGFLQSQSQISPQTGLPHFQRTPKIPLGSLPEGSLCLSVLPFPTLWSSRLLDRTRPSRRQSLASDVDTNLRRFTLRGSGRFQAPATSPPRIWESPQSPAGPPQLHWQLRAPDPRQWEGALLLQTVGERRADTLGMGHVPGRDFWASVKSGTGCLAIGQMERDAVELQREEAGLLPEEQLWRWAGR